jgi:pimeloyl-ACP methyl ester carboxylesterase
MRKTALVAGVCIAFLTACATAPEGSGGLARTDHYVTLKSSAPGMAGGETRVYVREIAAAAGSRIPQADRVVLFVHGGAFPGSTVFDLPHADYSWMRYFANAGYDTFAMDFTGFGASTRPAAMADPCNIAPQAQAQFVPVLIPKPCPPSHPGPITTMESEWEEMDAVIEHLRKLRGVDKVSIVAWSRGGPRTSGYLTRHPQKISRVFALAPDYNRQWPTQGSLKPLPGGSLQAGTQKGFNDNWNTQLGCEGQADATAREVVWKDSVSTDTVGAGWGPGVRRQLPRLGYGVNPEVAKQVRVPWAMATGPFDKIVPPAAVRAFYEDLASSEKVLIDLGCSSHFAMWEKNRALLFKASLDWIREGKVDGMSRGEMKLGY